MVVGGPDDPVGLGDGVSEFGRGDAAVDGPLQVRVPDLWVEDHPADLAEEPDLLVGRRGDRDPEFFQVAAGAVVGVGEAVVEQVEGLIGQVDQGLVEEGDEDRVAPLSGIRWRAWLVDRRAIWARNFRRFGDNEDKSQRSIPHRRQNSRFSRVTRIVRGVYDATDAEPGQA